MIQQEDGRRYLVEIDTAQLPQLFTDVLVIGSGIAGLRASIEASENSDVILVCKTELKDSNTWMAQGGIASVLDSGDSFEAHKRDTINAGCGLCDEEVVDMVIQRGPELIKELLDWGTAFDMESGKFAITREGGHSHARIAHAHGDETGRIIAQAMIDKVQSRRNIKVMEHFFAIDLITNDNNQCIGVIGADSRGVQIIWANRTVLASGGAGRLYRETTNPPVATADGIAMAYRAGAVMQDLEFMQFHPTTLYIAGASRALITEALRGEGALLVDSHGKQFMKDYHPDAELAPRDVVSRAILEQMLKTGSTHVYLDVRHFDKDRFSKRFPLISELCESFDIDIMRDLIPVRPSAHYLIGGIKADMQGRTSVENLLVCGESASTGVHGANRLGSNSLLEGLVFGQIAGEGVEGKSAGEMVKHPAFKYEIPHSDRTRLDTSDVRNSLRALMWRNVGITRREQPLREAMEIIRFWQRYVMDKVFDSPDGWECQNMLTAAMLMARSAYERNESRGVHFRSDFPETKPEYGRNTEITKAK